MSKCFELPLSFAVIELSGYIKELNETSRQNTFHQNKRFKLEIPVILAVLCL